MNTQTSFSVFCAALITLFFSFNSQAGLFELNGGDGAFNQAGDGTGNGRGISFLADADFNISSVGIFADLLQESFDVVIYSSSDGHQALNELASVTAISGGTGEGWNDININFSFDAGSYYAINWRPTDGNSNDWANSILYYPDFFLPNTVGPATLIDGFSGYDAGNFLNSLHPSLRINATVVPIPAAAWLMCSGLAGLLWIARRKT